MHGFYAAADPSWGEFESRGRSHEVIVFFSVLRDTFASHRRGSSENSSITSICKDKHQCVMCPQSVQAYSLSGP